MKKMHLMRRNEMSIEWVFVLPLIWPGIASDWRKLFGQMNELRVVIVVDAAVVDVVAVVVDIYHWSLCCYDVNINNAVVCFERVICNIPTKQTMLLMTNVESTMVDETTVLMLNRTTFACNQYNTQRNTIEIEWNWMKLVDFGWLLLLLVGVGWFGTYVLQFTDLILEFTKNKRNMRIEKYLKSTESLS